MKVADLVHTTPKGWDTLYRQTRDSDILAFGCVDSRTWSCLRWDFLQLNPLVMPRKLPEEQHSQLAELWVTYLKGLGKLPSRRHLWASLNFYGSIPVRKTDADHLATEVKRILETVL